MPRLHNRWFLLPVLLAGALAAVHGVPGVGRPDSEELRLDDWDIPQLVAYLKEKGLDLRTVSTRKDGILQTNAYLTTTEAQWEDLNELRKAPEQIELWRGTLYCERDCPRLRPAELDRLWGDCFFIAGPFLFFGDRQLLEQVRAALGSW